MLTQLRTERVLTKLVAGSPLTMEECRAVRPYLTQLLDEVSHWERVAIAEDVLYGSLQS